MAMDSIRVARVDGVVCESWQVVDDGPDAVPVRQRSTGTLHLTPHHLVFCPAPATTTTTPGGSGSSTEVWIAYPAITLLQRLPQAMHGLYPLLVRTRTFGSHVLLFDKDREGGAEDVWQSVKDCAVVASVEQLYAFSHGQPSTPRSPSSAGWATYSPRLEFARQGLGSRTKAWRFTDVNRDYALSPTYPSKLVVPSRISDSVLAHAARYRSKARIPALAYLHWANHASITRSSQPMVGLKNARSAQDERLVECIFSAHLFPDTPYAATNTAPQHAAPVYGSTCTNLIIDARPTTNAMANVAMGAGTENMDNYRTGKKAYLGIDNIHVMRNSLKMIDEAIREAELNPGSTLDRGLLRKSNWLRHISTLLDGALVIIKNVHLNASHVLIHCSDGWDRTSQLSATAQICLDPYYRTIDGFKVLVEKDWLSFGHKFLDRSGHLSSEKYFTIADTPEDDSDDELGGAQKAAQAFFATMQKQFASNGHLKEISPVFHQFLDSVRQIQRQFPDRFEFNEDLLLDLHTQTYACQYGTFLFNSERQRRYPHAGKPYVERTASIWEQIDRDREKYINPQFNPALDDRMARGADADQGVLLPDPKNVRFWHRLFRRGDREMNGPGLFGAAQVDPISADSLGNSASVSGPAVSRLSTPLATSPPPRTSSPSTPLAASTARTRPAEQQGPGWRWSQLSSGAFSAIQGAAREIKSISQEAYSQIQNRPVDSETDGDHGGMWTRDGPGYSSSPGFASAPKPTIGPTNAGIKTPLGVGPSRRPVRIPSEANPWAMPEDPLRPTVSSSSASSTSAPPPHTVIAPLQNDDSSKPLPKADTRNPWGSYSPDRLDLFSLSLDTKPQPTSVSPPSPARPATSAPVPAPAPAPAPPANKASVDDDDIKAALGGD